MGRKIVLDCTTPRPPPAVCPTCGAALSSVHRATLRLLPQRPCRCAPGRHPRAYEARCGGCGRLLVVHESDDGLTLAYGNQDELLKWSREADRGDLERILRDDRER